MKFKRVELKEGNNTNLRKFLIAASICAKMDIASLVGAPNIDKVVVHHITKNRSDNGIHDLVLMSDEQHRRMHAKYRFKEWNNQAHEDFDYVPVSEIINRLVICFEQESVQDEKLIVRV